MAKLMKIKTVLLTTILAVTIIFCSAGAVWGGKPFFGDLPRISEKYVKELSDLHTQYRAAKTDEDKNKIKVEKKKTRQLFKSAVEDFNKTTPLIGKLLPYEVVGDLPFKVQNVKITSIDEKSVKFTIQVKIVQDIKDAGGALSQRVKVFFMAFNNQNQKIGKTANYATNHDWVKLSAGTVYDAQGHWKSDRVQKLGEFGAIHILSEAEYKKLK